MNTPLFSILIAQYNNGRYFEDCYNSILAQSYQNWEVVILDDSSTDDSKAIMKQIIGEDKRFRFYQNDYNRGCGYTKRKLVELASGEICAFLDPDDAITDNAVAEMIDAHYKHPDASMIYSQPFICDEYLNITAEIESKQIQNHDPLFFNFEGSVFAFLSFKKIFYDKTIGINSYLKRAVDLDLEFLLYEVGPCFHVAKTLYKYRIHNNGISTNVNQDKAFFWYWVTIIEAAKRRNVNIENLFVEKALNSPTSLALKKEIDTYNKSFIFKAFRKIGLFKV